MRRNKVHILVLLFSLFSLHAWSQNTIRQFLFNRANQNVAYTGIGGDTLMYLVQRLQWVGFDGAPKSTGISIQHATKKRISWGLSIFSDKAAYLRNTSTELSTAYGVPINENHSLRFGLSIGAQFIDLDTKGQDYSNDPLITATAKNSLQVQGSFGAIYQYKDLIIGVALPTLINNEQQGYGFLRAHPYAQFMNQIYTVQYKFRINYSEFVAEPYFIYRLNRDLQNAWEMAGFVTYKEKFMTGLSYQSYNGVALSLGMNFYDRFRVSYSAEMPVTANNFPFAPSHEINLMMMVKSGNNKKKQESNILYLQPTSKKKKQETNNLQTTEAQKLKPTDDPNLKKKMSKVEKKARKAEAKRKKKEAQALKAEQKKKKQ